MVGDRQATGNYIASRDVRKIEPADHFTALAISGSAARGIEAPEDRPALLRALREDDRLGAQPRGQGQLPLADHPAKQPLLAAARRCRCSPGGTTSRQRVGSSSTTAPVGATSASTSPPSARVRRSPRARCDSAFARTSTAKARSSSRALALYEAGDNDPSHGRTGLRARDLPDDGHPRRRGLSRATRRARWGSASA